jgi:adenylosuccinate synthase
MSENHNGMPLDWGKLAFDSLFTGANQPGDQWLENARAAMKAEEVGQAGKQIGRAYVDAHERAAIIAIELRERLAGATNANWIKSMARTQAALERDAANSYFSMARGLLS